MANIGKPERIIVIPKPEPQRKEQPTQTEPVKEPARTRA